MNHGTHSMYVHAKCRCDDCRTAEKAYQQGYRAANGERLRAYDRQASRDTRLRDDPVKRKAREQAYDYNVRRKDAKKQPCSVCGDQNAEMHHDDYGKPLDVRWVCERCHGVEHRKEPNAAAKRGGMVTA